MFLQNLLSNTKTTMHSVITNVPQGNGCYEYKVDSRYVKEAEAKGAELGGCQAAGFDVPIMTFEYV